MIIFLLLPSLRFCKPPVLLSYLIVVNVGLYFPKSSEARTRISPAVKKANKVEILVILSGIFLYVVAYLSSYHEKAINALYELA